MQGGVSVWSSWSSDHGGNTVRLGGTLRSGWSTEFWVGSTGGSGQGASAVPAHEAQSLSHGGGRDRIRWRSLSAWPGAGVYRSPECPMCRLEASSQPGASDTACSGHKFLA